MQPLAGKVAFVTGGSRGIGAAIALRLARDGADVALTYLNRKDRAERVAGQIVALGRRAVAIEADNADPAAVAAAVDHAVETLDRLDILVNNAGVFPYGRIEEASLADLDQALGVHVRGVFVATKAAVRHMGRDGRVINIGSCLVDRVPYPGVSLYAMSKSALLGFTRGLARDLGERGITVNLVHPGSTDTEMNPAGTPEATAELPYIALGRYATPAEVAATVGHLAGPGGRYITGASIPVDGGFAA
nr:SDR family oxidoreductase [Micromonospora sp. DSM 115978]